MFPTHILFLTILSHKGAHPGPGDPGFKSHFFFGVGVGGWGWGWGGGMVFFVIVVKEETWTFLCKENSILTPLRKWSGLNAQCACM